MDERPDYDAMFQQSQNNPYSLQRSDGKPSFDEEFRRQYAKKEKKPVTPEVLDSNGRSLRSKPQFSSAWLAPVSLVIGAVSFLLIFAGMFLHLLLWLNILFCLIGAGFAVAALLSKSGTRILGVFGLALNIFTLLVNVICLIIVMITSGVSAIFHLLS